jgi:hypothetical protein
MISASLLQLFSLTLPLLMSFYSVLFTTYSSPVVYMFHNPKSALAEFLLVENRAGA